MASNILSTVMPVLAQASNPAMTTDFLETLAGEGTAPLQQVSQGRLTPVQPPTSGCPLPNLTEDPVGHVLALAVKAQEARETHAPDLKQAEKALQRYGDCYPIAEAGARSLLKGFAATLEDQAAAQSLVNLANTMKTPPAKLPGPASL